MRDWQEAYAKGAETKVTSHLKRKYSERADSCGEVRALIDQAMRELIFAP